MKLVAINKSEKKFLINVPGLTKDDISIRIENRTVFVTQKNEKKVPEGWTVVENEFLKEIKEIQHIVGPFARSFVDPRIFSQIEKAVTAPSKLQFNLDYNPKVSDTKAVVENGQLIITIPELDSGQEIVIE